MRVLRIAIATAALIPCTAAAQQPNPAATHVSHVTTRFADTPDQQGLLAVAFADARAIAQHAILAARNTGSLDAMKLHAGHVIHAIEPESGSSGPGTGYGLKRAANAVAAHIEMAGRAQGASAALSQHAPHVATSARNTATRADSILNLARRIQAATTAADAATLLAELKPLADALLAGVDANGNGTVEWREGGLDVAEQHLKMGTAGNDGI